MIRSALILTLIWFSTLGFADDQSNASEDLIQASHRASGLESGGPYQMEATLVFHPGRKEEARGKLRFMWETGRSRLQIEFANYVETDVTVGNRVYVTRSTPVPPLELLELESIPRSYPVWHAVHLSGVPTSPSFAKAIDGTPAECFDVKVEKYARRRSCFDSARKVLMLTEATTSNESHSTQFLDYRAVGEQLIPSRVRFLEKNSLTLELRDIQVKRSSLDTSLFDIPQNSLQVGACDDMKPPQSLKRDVPLYPTEAMVGRITGEVYIYMVIAADGSVQNPKVISGHPVLASAAMDAIRKWRYTPPTCDSGPVAIESHVKVSFHQ